MDYSERWLQDVKQQMRRIADHPYADTKVGDVLNSALDTNGKMLRARMLILSAQFGQSFKEKKDRLCTLAAMVELTHLASLIHDDIIDEADFRRGKPSVQAKYGKDAAVYSGDFLMSRIYYYAAAEKLNEPAMCLSKAIEAMCTGEIGQALCRYRETTSVETYMQNIKGKTSALFKTACTIGATEGGADAETVRRLAQIGEDIGYMFQLRDDLLDFTEDKYHLGKEAHKDFAEGVYTLPILAALKVDDGRLLALAKKNSKSALSEEEISQAERLAAELGGVDYTKSEIRRLSQNVQALLLELPKNEAATLLKQLVINLEEK